MSADKKPDISTEYAVRIDASDLFEAFRKDRKRDRFLFLCVVFVMASYYSVLWYAYVKDVERCLAAGGAPAYLGDMIGAEYEGCSYDN